ncbi:hypothetical protein SAMN02745866_02332 [Alteromonadaceae bacterium Bs31]|nr:hypothetical protein SAMN02745866_02332 [Alteromonadaceae bacterium Bs31]
MSVIPASFTSLVRTRRSLEKAYQSGDWESVREVDVLLGDCLNRAFDDSDRDTTVLIEELEKVLRLYANIVSTLPVQGVAADLKIGNTLQNNPPLD